MTRLVILGRDGVINEDSDQFIKSPAEWIPIPGSLYGISRLTKAGFRVVVATNQDAVSRGLFDATTLQKIHSKMHHAVTAAGGRLDAVYFCPHGSTLHCTCRKPAPGMLLDCLHRFSAQASEVTMIGDRWQDLAAASAAGCQPVLVRTGNGLKTLAQADAGIKPLPEGTLVMNSLEAWVLHTLSQEQAA
jgi:D-glycero-D-manno-heptose 1,7-bisphosphate phosphatase